MEQLVAPPETFSAAFLSDSVPEADHESPPVTDDLLGMTLDEWGRHQMNDASLLPLPRRACDTTLRSDDAGLMESCEPRSAAGNWGVLRVSAERPQDPPKIFVRLSDPPDIFARLPHPPAPRVSAERPPDPPNMFARLPDPSAPSFSAERPPVPTDIFARLPDQPATRMRTPIPTMGPRNIRRLNRVGFHD